MPDANEVLRDLLRMFPDDTDPEALAFFWLTMARASWRRADYWRKYAESKTANARRHQP
jgi:hypothetical protein